MPKIISVAAKNKGLLEKALNAAGSGVAFGAGSILGQDAYNKVKGFLNDNGVTYSEHDSTNSVPSDHVHH